MSTLIERMTSAGSEGARRATGGLADGGAAAGVRDPEVSEKAKRRRFSAEYKLRIVREADACKGDGDVAALLRREGLYSSHLSSWRRQRDEIAKAGLTSRKRGRKAKAEAPRIKELESRERPTPAPAGSGGNDARDPKKSLRAPGDPPEPDRRRRERLIVAAEELAGRIGQTAEACEALGVVSFHVVSSTPTGDVQAEAPSSAAASPRHDRAREGPQCIALRTVRRQGAGPGVGHASGRGNLPLFDPHDVPDSVGARRGA